MDSWVIFFAIGFILGLLLGLRFWWSARQRANVAERLLRTPLGQLAMRNKR